MQFAFTHFTYPGVASRKIIDQKDVLAKGGVPVLEIFYFEAAVHHLFKRLDALRKDGAPVGLALRVLLELPEAKAIDHEIFC